MVRIRLARHGRRKNPFYRIVVADSEKKRDGAYIELIGWYNPIAKEKADAFSVEAERAQYWLSQGAQPSETVSSILKKAGVETKETKKPS